jgi:hypothetical protein
MYLIEYIKQTQADFPGVSASPIDVLTHLLYVNGNGIGIVDGNPVVVHDNGLRYTTFKNWYSQVVPFQDMKDELDKDWNANEQIKDYYNSITGMRQRIADAKGEEYDSEATWKIASDRFRDRYTDVDSVENYTLDDLKSVDVLQSMIEAKKYSPYLNLSPSFYKQDLFTDGTDNNLLEVAIALSQAYINVLQKHIDGELEYKSQFLVNLTGKFGEDIDVNTLKSYKSDIITLTFDINKMKGFMTKGISVYLTDEFLFDITEVAKHYGWEGDYIEVENFVKELYYEVDKIPPNLDTYDEE